MNFFSKLFLIEIDFWRAEVIQGFVWNFNLYFLNFFNGACTSITEFIWFRKESKERLTFCWTMKYVSPIFIKITKYSNLYLPLSFLSACLSPPISYSSKFEFSKCDPSLFILFAKLQLEKFLIFTSQSLKKFLKLASIIFVPLQFRWRSLLRFKWYRGLKFWCFIIHRFSDSHRSCNAVITSCAFSFNLYPLVKFSLDVFTKSIILLAISSGSFLNLKSLVPICRISLSVFDVTFLSICCYWETHHFYSLVFAFH